MCPARKLHTAHRYGPRRRSTSLDAASKKKRNCGIGHVDAAPQHGLADSGTVRPPHDLVAGSQPEEDVDENVAGQRLAGPRFRLWGRVFLVKGERRKAWLVLCNLFG
jgi:hypothetical protein